VVAGPADESGTCDQEAVGQGRSGERFAGGLGLAVPVTVDLFVVCGGQQGGGLVSTGLTVGCRCADQGDVDPLTRPCAQGRNCFPHEAGLPGHFEHSVPFLAGQGRVRGGISPIRGHQACAFRHGTAVDTGQACHAVAPAEGLPEHFTP
jgi:hypothetical protein